MELSALLNSNEATLVDVRETWEFSSGHAPGAVNIPLGLIPLRVQELKDKGQPIFLYCRSGGRSGQATAFLQSQGMGEVYNAGGLDNVLQLLEGSVA